MSTIKTLLIAKSATNEDIRHMNAKPRPCRHKNLKDIAITIKSMNIQLLNANPKQCGSSNRQTKVRNNGKSYNQDYNTRYSYHYCQEYGHVPENCIRTHFCGNYKRWLSQTTCFSYSKTRHISKHCPTKLKAQSCEFDKGKGKANVEHIREVMNKR